MSKCKTRHENDVKMSSSAGDVIAGMLPFFFSACRESHRLKFRLQIFQPWRIRSECSFSRRNIALKQTAFCSFHQLTHSKKRYDRVMSRVAWCVGHDDTETDAIGFVYFCLTTKSVLDSGRLGVDNPRLSGADYA